jgi:hypothetical protein
MNLYGYSFVCEREIEAAAYNATGFCELLHSSEAIPQYLIGSGLRSVHVSKSRSMSTSFRRHDETHFFSLKMLRLPCVGLLCR